MSTRGFVRLVVREDSPLEPRAQVFVEEEDGFLVLSAPTDIPEQGPHPIRVMNAVWQAEARPVPSLEKQGRRWLLVLHDLAAEPSTDEAILKQGLELLFEEAERDGVESLELPLLGAVHGVIPPTRAAALLVQVLSARWFHHLRRVVVRGSVPPDVFGEDSTKV